MGRPSFPEPAKTEHPQQTIVSMKTAGQQPGQVIVI